jgi:hypothetical protein
LFADYATLMGAQHSTESDERKKRNRSAQGWATREMQSQEWGGVRSVTQCHSRRCGLAAISYISQDNRRLGLHQKCADRAIIECQIYRAIMIGLGQRHHRFVMVMMAPVRMVGVRRATSVDMLVPMVFALPDSVQAIAQYARRAINQQKQPSYPAVSAQIFSEDSHGAIIILSRNTNCKGFANELQMEV